MRSIWAAGFLLRRLRVEAGVVALLLALVSVTSFLFAGAPRLFNLVADAALVHELRAASVVQRDLQISTVSVTPPGDDELGAVERVGTEYLARLPESLRAVIGEHRYSVTSGRFRIAEPPRYPTFISLRYQDGLGDALRIVDGRLPAATGDQLPRALVDFDEPPTTEPPAAARIEIAISEATAEEIGVRVGDSLLGTLDGSDPILRTILLRQTEARFEVVGIFSILDPSAEVWFEDRSLQRPAIGGTDENPIAYATGLLAPEAYPALTTSDLPFSFAWRYFLAPERADVGQLETLVVDLRRLRAEGANNTFGSSMIDGSLVLRTGLLTVIGRYQLERAASEAVLSVAAIGPFALATGAIGMVGIMLVMRRRTSLELARTRGASAGVLLAAQLWEAALLTGGAALIGLLLAILIAPGRESSLSAPGAMAIAIAATTILVAATWPIVRRQLGQPRRDDPPVLPTSPRRLVLELTGVGLAVAGVVLLQQRGLVIGEGEAGQVVRFDPFLAAVPVLAGLATGLVAMRLYPLPIRAMSWLAAARRDLVPVLGLRSVGRHSASANLPLLVLMLTAAFGAFASVVLSSIDHGQEEIARLQVGADYRIEVAVNPGNPLLDPASVDGVQAVAAAYIDQTATYADPRSGKRQVVLHAVEPGAYADITAGSPLTVAWPSSFNAVEAPPGLVGTPAHPIPAIISHGLPSGSRSLARGDTFDVEVAAQVMTFVVVEGRPSFPGIRSGAPFVVTSFSLLQDAYRNPPLSPSVLLVRGASEIEPQLSAFIRDRSPSSVISSRYERHATLRDAPFVTMVTGGFRIAVVLAVLYAALAIVAALTLTAARRSHDLAFLRTLGLSARQALGLTIVEHGPPVALALLPGIALGIAVAVLLGPALGLVAFIDPDATFKIHIQWAEIAVVGAGLVVMVTIAGAAGTWLARRARPVDALRTTE